MSAQNKEIEALDLEGLIDGQEQVADGATETSAKSRRPTPQPAKENTSLESLLSRYEESISSPTTVGDKNSGDPAVAHLTKMVAGSRADRAREDTSTDETPSGANPSNSASDNDADDGILEIATTDMPSRIPPRHMKRVLPLVLLGLAIVASSAAATYAVKSRYAARQRENDQLVKMASQLKAIAVKRKQEKERAELKLQKELAEIQEAIVKLQEPTISTPLIPIDDPADGAEGTDETDEAPQVGLSREDIRASMEPVLPRIKACGPQDLGQLRLQVTVATKGNVEDVQALGSYGGTPLGKCAENVVRGALFPSFRGSVYSFTYPTN